MATTATQVVLDTPAAEFRLPATDGKTYALDDVAGEKGTVVVFICNHCPYVKAVIDRMISDARVLSSIPPRRDADSRSGVWGGLYAGLLRLQCRPQAQV